LAIDLRSRRFGYVVFEDTVLVDFGTRINEDSRLLIDELPTLLKKFTPMAVVVRLPRHSRMRHKIRAITAKARNGKMRFRVLDSKQVKRYYRQIGASNKNAVATLISSRIPELEPLIPALRKNYDAEHNRQTLFDALATGVCYLGVEKFGISTTPTVYQS
jgi:hypothetical protein